MSRHLLLCGAAQPLLLAFFTLTLTCLAGSLLLGQALCCWQVASQDSRYACSPLHMLRILTGMRALFLALLLFWLICEMSTCA